MTKIKSICIYCGSQPGNGADYTAAAQSLGASIAKHGITLVYGGGTRGIMGTVSQAARVNGGIVKGIIPEFLLKYEGDGMASQTDPDIIVTDNMHERKQKMFELSDAFVALPGGIGTLEEIVEIMTWAQLDRHRKPIAFLNTNGFWNPMLELLEHMKTSGFIHAENRVQPYLFNTPAELAETLFA